MVNSRTAALKGDSCSEHIPEIRGCLDYSRPGLLKSYILMKVDRLAAGAPNLVHHRLAAGIVHVGHHNLGAFSRQCRRTRCANSRCAARYDRYLALYLAHGRPPLPRNPIPQRCLANYSRSVLALSDPVLSQLSERSARIKPDGVVP